MEHIQITVNRENAGYSEYAEQIQVHLNQMWEQFNFLIDDIHVELL